MNLEEYIKLYEKKTGTSFVRKEGFLFFFGEDKGFCEYKLEDSGVYIWNLCGDLMYWLGMAHKACEEFNLPAISGFVLRNPKAFIRCMKFRICSVEEIDSQFRYHCVNAIGEKLTATQHGNVFTFVWEVNLNV